MTCVCSGVWGQSEAKPPARRAYDSTCVTTRSGSLRSCWGLTLFAPSHADVGLTRPSHARRRLLCVPVEEATPLDVNHQGIQIVRQKSRHKLGTADLNRLPKLISLKTYYLCEEDPVVANAHVERQRVELCGFKFRRQYQISRRVAPVAALGYRGGGAERGRSRCNLPWRSSCAKAHR